MSAQLADVVAPGGALALRVHHDDRDGTLRYEVRSNEVTLITSSRLGIQLGPGSVLFAATVVCEEPRSISSRWCPLWGQHDVVTDRCTEARFRCAFVDEERSIEVAAELVVRAYDDAIAFRFSSLREAHNRTLTVNADLTEFRFPAEPICSMARGEWAPHPAAPLSRCNWTASSPSNLPVIAKLPGAGYLALFEGPPGTFSPMRITRTLGSEHALRCAIEPSVVEPGASLPWRIVLVGDRAGDFLTTSVPLNLADPCRLEKTDWIKPGVALWDWRIRGAVYNRFSYGMDAASIRRLAGFAAEMGFSYVIVDAGWSRANEGLPTRPRAGLALEEIMADARNAGIGLILYYDLKYVDAGFPEIPFEDVAREIAALGASGIKFGFLGTAGKMLSGQQKARTTIRVMETCARHRLLISFHDDPIPMPGAERTWPHCLTREYCHAQQDGRRAFDASEYQRLLFVNAVCGPMDQANGVYAIRAAGSREKGPRNRIRSTIAGETARTGQVYSGMVVLPDAPEAYRARHDAFEVLRGLPAAWDESTYLDGCFARYAIVARRRGQTWYVFGTTDTTPREVVVSLGFLNSSSWHLTLVRDAPDSDSVRNPESYSTASARVAPSDSLRIWMASGGGFCCRLVVLS